LFRKRKKEKEKRNSWMVPDFIFKEVYENGYYD